VGIDMSSALIRRVDETPRSRGLRRWSLAGGTVLLACLRFPGAAFERLFRIGFAVLFKAPLAMSGLLLVMCACLLLFGFGQQIYEYNHDPMHQLQSARNALVAARNMDRKIAELRHAKGLQPVPREQLFAPALEAKVGRLEAEIAAGHYTGGSSSTAPQQPR
jgi:hypothetical protein